MKEIRKNARKSDFIMSIIGLFKRQFGTKIRVKSSLFEIIFSIVLPFVIIFISLLGRSVYNGSQDAPYDNHTQIGYDLGKFLAISKEASGKATFFILPRNEKTEFLAQELFGDFSKFDISIQYCDTLEEMEDLIYQTNNNGVGIYWKNSNETDAEYNPEVEVYLQSLYGNPSEDLFRITRSVISRKHKRYALAAIDTYSRQMASPDHIQALDLNMTLMIFSIWPVFFSATPDAQTVLDDRNTKIFTLMNLMGCPESAYFFVMFCKWSDCFRSE